MEEKDRITYAKALEKYKPFTITEKGCWETRLKPGKRGYTLIRVNGKVFRLHVISYIANVGTIPPGLYILHKCDNKRCINPEHLYMGTQFDNMQDRAERYGRTLPVDLSGENSPSAKLNWEKVREIRASDSKLVTLAKKYNVTDGTIWYVRKGITWREKGGKQSEKRDR